EEFGVEQIYQRDVYDRDVDSFQEPSDFYARDLHEISKRGNEFYDGIVDALYKRELNRLNTLFGRAPPRPKFPPTKPSTGGSSRKSPSKGHGFGASGSSHSSDTDESTDTSKIVGMAKIKTSHDKPVTIVGVQGCTGIFLHGDGFITGAHATPQELPQTAARAAQEAMRSGTATGIRIYGPSAANVKIVKETIERLIPHIIAYVQIYHDQPGVYDWEFKATQAGAVTMTRIPV
ncbi:hypothetical protein MMC14_009601, partial [Varicellaria rhodocarpa]|nr:hypothetical protein [Varicellaria rhodocarpa]